MLYQGKVDFDDGAWPRSAKTRAIINLADEGVREHLPDLFKHPTINQILMDVLHVSIVSIRFIVI